MAPCICDDLSIDYASEVEDVLKALKSNGHSLHYASMEMRDDPYIVHYAVKNEPNALMHASKRIRDDEDFVSIVMALSGFALKHASERLKDVRNVALVAVMNNGLSLQYASDNLKKDKNIVAEAVSSDGLSLQFADPALQAEKDMVLKAVANNGLALQYACTELRKDEHVVRAAIESNGLAFEHAAGVALQSDWDVLTKAICTVHLQLIKDKDRFFHYDIVMRWSRRQAFSRIRIGIVRAFMQKDLAFSLHTFLNRHTMRDVIPDEAVLSDLRILSANITEDDAAVGIIDEYVEFWDFAQYGGPKRQRTDAMCNRDRFSW